MILSHTRGRIVELFLLARVKEIVDAENTTEKLASRIRIVLPCVAFFWASIKKGCFFCGICYKRASRSRKEEVLMILSHTRGGCVIQLHLQDGTLQGKVDASLSNWVGEILRGGRSDIEWLLKHERAQKPGIYLLQGKDPSPTDDDRKKVYIGLSNRNLQSRLRAHVKSEKMDFWDTACLITASGEQTMNHNNCHYLEAMLIQQAIDAKRAIICNKQKPLSGLASIDKQTPEDFIHYLNLVLPIINIDFLNPLRATDKTIRDFMFELFHQSSGVHATANQIKEDFFVLKNSCASIEKTRKTQMPKNKSTRQELIDEKSLEKNKDTNLLMFTKDVKFSSASAAASVILNGHAGVREWKIKGTNKKKTYNDWRENPQAFTANFS